MNLHPLSRMRIREMKDDIQMLSIVDKDSPFEDLIRGGIETGRLVDIQMQDGVAILTELEEVTRGIFRFSGKLYMNN